MQEVIELAAERDQNGRASRRANWARNHARVEQVRSLLARGWTRGQIKHHCSIAWNLKRRCVEDYIDAANKRLAEHLEFDGKQTLSQSLAYWSEKLNEAESRVEEGTAGIAQASQAIAALAPEQIKERASLLKLLESHRKRRYGALQDSMEIYDRIDRLRGHVHSGGSASVLIQQQFINGGQASLNEGQRRDQLAAIGMVPAGELPLILDVPAQALPAASPPSSG